jgi:acetoin utilization protein AcuC
MNDRKLAFVYPHEIEPLSYPPDCPFKTSRATDTRKRLAGFGLLGSPNRTETSCPQATLQDLLPFHSPAYLQCLQEAATGHLTVEALHMGLGTPDTPVFKDLLEYGRWATGASLKAADLLLQRQANIAFALLGGFHHAMAEKAAGFCYVNDIVLACQHLAQARQRVLCLDIDAHHGDGTQAAFYDRSDIMTISFHESGNTLFPWGGFEDEIGEGEGRGYNVNVPLPPETYDDAFLHAFRTIVPPLSDSFQPDVIVLELGMDTLAGDPLTHLALTNNAHVDVIEILLGLNRPILVTGGGGYHAENTVRGWALAWMAFAGEIEHDYGLGMGGVMLENTDWTGGLRDRHLPLSPEQRSRVEPAIHATLRKLQQALFPLHNLRT